MEIVFVTKKRHKKDFETHLRMDPSKTTNDRIFDLQDADW